MNQGNSDLPCFSFTLQVALVSPTNANTLGRSRHFVFVSFLNRHTMTFDVIHMYMDKRRGCAMVD